MNDLEMRRAARVALSLRATRNAPRTVQQRLAALETVSRWRAARIVHIPGMRVSLSRWAAAGELEAQYHDPNGRGAEAAAQGGRDRNAREQFTSRARARVPPARRRLPSVAWLSISINKPDQRQSQLSRSACEPRELFGESGVRKLRNFKSGRRGTTLHNNERGLCFI